MTNPTLFSFWLLILALSCSNQPEKAPAEAVIANEIPKKPLARDYPKDLAAVPEFPGRPYHKVIAYELNGRIGMGWAAAVFENQTGKQVELTDPQVEEFLSIFNNRESYGYTEMSCFDPRIGLVFYDASDQIVAYLSLCLQCNNVRSEPPLDFDFDSILDSGFTKKAYWQLLDLFNAWGIPHEHSNSHME